MQWVCVITFLCDWIERIDTDRMHSDRVVKRPARERVQHVPSAPTIPFYLTLPPITH